MPEQHASVLQGQGGISSRNAMDYSTDKAGVHASFARMDAAVNEVRETGSVSEDWKK